MDPKAQIENWLGHTFRNPDLLMQALTHSSFANEKKAEGISVEDYERYEFLGDAVIGLAVAELLMQKFPQAAEGELSRWRSQLVSRTGLTKIAEGAQLGKFLRFGNGETRTGGPEKPSILAAALEAIVGALYQDAGLDVTQHFLSRIFKPFMEQMGTQSVQVLPDNKTLLQEAAYIHKKVAPLYKLEGSWGPEHEKMFKVSVEIETLGRYFGEGRSKKEAEQVAAGQALEALSLFAQAPGTETLPTSSPDVGVDNVF